MYRYRAELVRVVDGDTVDLKVDLGFHMTACLRFRLLGIDAPEVRGPEKIDGRAATHYLQSLLAGHDTLYVESVKTGKFGRWLGLIYTGARSRITVNDQMVTAGHAVVAEY